MSKSHSICAETFYKTALAEQIQGEPARSNEDKRQMLELLKRFEEEAEESDQPEDTDDIAFRLRGIDLDSANYDTLWERLTEEEKQDFLKIIKNPSSEKSKRLFSTKELTEKPWWESDAAPEGKAPVIRSIPPTMLESTKFNPMLLYNVFHVSLSYAYTIRTFGVSRLGPANHEPSTAQEETEEFNHILFPLSPFLMDRKSTLTFTSVDGVITDWLSPLPEASCPCYLTRSMVLMNKL
ncbi:hypothetical protein FRC07_001297 [Ceratobasidium sp. 392]|nr:hypothetical protein FRC07_001297 [Ceratobasidium sp. 392]